MKFVSHGPLLIDTDFWETNPDRIGLHVEGNHLRFLLPKKFHCYLDDIRYASEVRVKFNGSDVDFYFNRIVEYQFVATLLSDPPKSSDGLMAAFYTERRGKPRRAAERMAFLEDTHE